MNNKMTICFFGRYDNEYSRNRILIKGLGENDVKVIECRTELKGVKKYFDLIKKHWKLRKEYDVLFVAFPGYQAMILARFLTRRKIIFDSFAPLYESEVLDRGNTKKGSFKARYYWYLDKFSAKWANLVLLDTNEHIKYFIQEFGFNPSADGGKFERIFIGSEPEFFSPQEKYQKINQKFIIHYHGNDIPLQGVKYILESAKLLEKYPDIQFNFVGPRLKRRYANKGFNNINFVGHVPYEQMGKYINQSDICLGIFGDTNKTQRVIPNKLYECVACQKPTITADTPAIRELFNENSLELIPIADSKALENTILALKNKPNKMENLAKNGYNVFIKNGTPLILGSELKKIAQRLI